jgi:hypothetical protein
VSVAPGVHHVYFDGLPELVGHVCDAHRAIGIDMGCLDLRPDGDCPHVQTRPCDCDPQPDCAAADCPAQTRLSDRGAVPPGEGAEPSPSPVPVGRLP